MQYYAITYSDSYLQHHGIMGMKWGVRRFQDKAGRLTAAGRKRLGYSVERAKKTVKDPEFQRKAKTAAKVAGVAAATGLATYGAYKISPKVAARIVKRGAGIVGRISTSNVSGLGKSIATTGKTIQAIHGAQQVKKGAEQLTLMRRRSDAPLALGIGAVTAAMAGGAAAISYDEDYGDKVISDRAQFRRVARSGGIELHDNFYATPNLKDAKRYDRDLKGGNGSALVIERNGPAKIAGRAHGKDAFEKALKNNPNSDYKKGDWDRFNRNIMFLQRKDRSSEENNKLFNDFKSELQKKGYNGLIDTNDAKGPRKMLFGPRKQQTGWGTKDPYILFKDDKFRVALANGKSMKDAKVVKYKEDNRKAQKLAALKAERWDFERRHAGSDDEAYFKANANYEIAMNALKQLRKNRVLDKQIDDLNADLFKQNQDLLDRLHALR